MENKTVKNPAREAEIKAAKEKREKILQEKKIVKKG